MTRCDVPGCPERYRCLDVDQATRCALFRLYRRDRAALWKEDAAQDDCTGPSIGPGEWIVIDGCIMMDTVHDASCITGDTEADILSCASSGHMSASGRRYSIERRK